MDDRWPDGLQRITDAPGRAARADRHSPGPAQ